LAAEAQMPHRVDSIPAARSFLAKLLDGWGVTETGLDGRGIWLVQSIARDWGSDSSGEEPGKTVWFELTTLRTPSG